MTDLNVPFLRSGKGDWPADGGCIMQVIDWIHRGGWADTPDCVHPVIRGLAIGINDSVPDQERQRLLDLAPRMMGTSESVPNLARAHDLASFVLQRTMELVEFHMATTSVHRAVEETYLRAVEAITARPAPDGGVLADLGRDVDELRRRAPLKELNNLGTGLWAHLEMLSGGYYDMLSNAMGWYPLAVANGLEKIDRILLPTLDEYDRLTGRTKVEEIDFAPVCAMLAAAK